MAFPISPTDGQQAVVGNTTYQYSSADNSWTRLGGQVPTLSIAGNVSAGNVYSLGPVSAVGNITGAYFIGNGSQLTGLPAGYSNSDVSNYLASGTDTANIITTGNVSGNFILGNGAFLSGVITSVANINNGTSNVTVVSSGGNITVGVSGVGNVAVFAPTGEYVTGVLSVSGNVTGGNLVTGGDITATGNIVAGGVRTTTSSLAPTSPAPVVGDMWVNSDIGVTYRYTYDGTSYFWEDFTGGGLATNADAIVNGTSNVTITQNSNVTVGIAGTTRATFAGATMYVASNIVPTANNVYSLGSPTAQWASVYLSANTLYLGTTPLSANTTSNTLTIGGNAVVTANPTGTSSTTGNVQVVGNVTGSNLFTSGQISATGDIRSDSYVYANVVSLGSPLAASGLIHVYNGSSFDEVRINGADSSISATGNITGGNVVVGNITISTNSITSANTTLYIDPAADGGVNGLVVINGNLQVNGNTTTINSNVVSINDLVFNVANNASSGSQANNGGIGVGPVGSEYATLLYNNSGNVWASNLGISSAGNITGGNVTTSIVSASGNIVGNNLSITNTLTASGSLVTHAILETATITASAPAATTNFDLISQAVQYYTTNANANVTLNFRGNSSVSANTMLAVGQSTTVALMWTNGSSAYYPNVIQVDSANVTTKWQGGTAPSAGNANSVDIYAFTILKTGSGTYAVFGSQTKFA